MTEPHPSALGDIHYLRDELGLRTSEIDWERLLTISYRHYLTPGCAVIDVGAHHGMHSRRFIRYLRPQHLVLVEPIPEMAAGLRHEFRRRKQVTVRQVALGAEARETTFVINDASPGESGLVERRYTKGQPQTRAIDVTVERLDDWQLPFTVDFVKVDVEGGEVDVLKGGRRFLSQHRPVVSVEYGTDSYSAYGWNNMTLYEFAVASDYRLVDLFGNLMGADEWGHVVDAYNWDFILLPDEKVSSSADARTAIRAEALRSIRHFRPGVERWRKRLRR